jgi:hypothetical protein
MKVLIFSLLILSFGCQKKEAENSSNAVNAEATEAVKAEEDCDEKAKKAQAVVIDENNIQLGGNPDAGCTLEE